MVYKRSLEEQDAASAVASLGDNGWKRTRIESHGSGTSSLAVTAPNAEPEQPTATTVPALAPTAAAVKDPLQPHLLFIQPRQSVEQQQQQQQQREKERQEKEQQQRKEQQEK